jgi:hypothetical protein
VWLRWPQRYSGDNTYGSVMHGVQCTMCYTMWIRLGAEGKNIGKNVAKLGMLRPRDCAQGLDGIHQRDLWWVFMSSVGPPSLVITPSLSISAKPDGISRIQPERDPSGGVNSRAVFFVETKLLEIWTYIHTLAQ